ncbi:MAG: response regulator transcription factor [Saprospirales bacterium]|nr:response regulator transcription factor [Saprospirales bacterium]
MDFRIIIVDDEVASRKTIRRFLAENCPYAVVIGEAGSVAEAERLLREQSTDLLLLDVMMGDGTGFNLLDRFPKLNFNVVFTTAHNDFAIRAFRYNAIDYLLKPIDPDELTNAVRKAREHINHEVFQEQIAQLLRVAAEKKLRPDHAQHHGRLCFANTKDIARIETYGNYTFVFLAGGERHLVSRNLSEFEEMLPSPHFFRLHQSHMVNTAFVKKFLKKTVAMRSCKTIPDPFRKRRWAALRGLFGVGHIVIYSFPGNVTCISSILLLLTAVILKV